jgi:hypothetical protein
MCHHFVHRGGCHHRSYLGKSVIAAPTLSSCVTQGVADVCTSGRRCHARAPQDPPSWLLSPRRRAHLMGPSPRACPRDSMLRSLPPRRRARLRGGHHRALASGIRRRERVPRSAVARLLLGSAAARASLGWGVTIVVAKTEP